MDNTHEYNDLDIDPKNEELETELDSEQIETEEGDSDSDELTRLRSENKKLAEIIKRRKERDEKTSTSTNSPTQPITNDTKFLTREEAILVASGFSNEDLDYLNVVAKGTNLGINEAKEHPLFQAYMQRIEAEKKAKRAKLGASKGSSVTKPVSMAGLTAEDHKKLWAEKLGL